MSLQSVIRAFYPTQCVACETATETDNGLCPACWAETQFIHGTICDTCGAPLIGDSDGEALQCDDCMTTARPWSRGRAALIYANRGRRLVLALKHGDRTDLAGPAAAWMAHRAGPILDAGAVLVPVPLHWTRLLTRRFNQAALLSGELAKLSGALHCPDALRRPQRTRSLGHDSARDRFALMADAISFTPRRAHLLQGRRVVLVDDVMTSGATLAAAAEAARAAGADDVCILTLARTVRES